MSAFLFGLVLWIFAGLLWLANIKASLWVLNKMKERCQQCRYRHDAKWTCISAEKQRKWDREERRLKWRLLVHAKREGWAKFWIILVLVYTVIILFIVYRSK